MKIHLIGAARPNFMKIAPLYHKLREYDEFEPIIVHTGQHYDANMSDMFFKDLRLPKPDIQLGIRGGGHSETVGRTMIEYENVCQEKQPDLVIVVGDVNATMACSITAKKLGIEVAHLEAGIRSFDMSMPEEINRKVTDSIVDYFWTPSVDANENLVREGISSSKIKLVGNIMIDSLEMLRPDIELSDIYKKYNLDCRSYAVATFHRPSNVDHIETLRSLVYQLNEAAKQCPIIFPIHPRTKARLENFGLWESINSGDVLIKEPLGYKEFMNLLFHSRMVLTDSGGLQEETTYLGIPCITFRPNTERPITIREGTNTLSEISEMKKYVYLILSGDYKKGHNPILWDGKTAERIVNILLEKYEG